MPEGHAIHRHARLQSQHFVGTPLQVSSPQGRFADGAALLDGGVIWRIEAYGKHLFYRWKKGHTLHVHLGLYGRFRSGEQRQYENMRLLMEATSMSLQLSGPSICELIDVPGEEQILARLGPDPLRGDPDAVARVAEALSRRQAPIGAALLDQKVIAGIGNVYRSELLFLIGLNPAAPASSLEHVVIERLWGETRRQMRSGEKAGRIVTVSPENSGSRPLAELSDEERLYVYGREGLPCRRCGTIVVAAELAGRRIWHCPRCQPDEMS